MFYLYLEFHDYFLRFLVGCFKEPFLGDKDNMRFSFAGTTARIFQDQKKKDERGSRANLLVTTKSVTFKDHCHGRHCHPFLSHFSRIVYYGKLRREQTDDEQMSKASQA